MDYKKKLIETFDLVFDRNCLINQFFFSSKISSGVNFPYLTKPPYE